MHRVRGRGVRWRCGVRRSESWADLLGIMNLYGLGSMGVLFGGVSDEDKDEETLESVFHNEL